MSKGDMYARLQAMFDQCDVKHCPMSGEDRCARCQYAIESVKVAIEQNETYERITKELMEQVSKLRSQNIRLKQRLSEDKA